MTVGDGVEGRKRIGKPSLGNQGGVEIARRNPVSGRATRGKFETKWEAKPGWKPAVGNHVGGG